MHERPDCRLDVPVSFATRNTVRCIATPREQPCNELAANLYPAEQDSFGSLPHPARHFIGRSRILDLDSRVLRSRRAARLALPCFQSRRLCHYATELSTQVERGEDQSAAGPESHGHDFAVGHVTLSPEPLLKKSLTAFFSSNVATWPKTGFGWTGDLDLAPGIDITCCCRVAYDLCR
jgi:hypothetical protein